MKLPLVRLQHDQRMTQRIMIGDRRRSNAQSLGHGDDTIYIV